MWRVLKVALLSVHQTRTLIRESFNDTPEGDRVSVTQRSSPTPAG
jgi:hypothetical protein